MIQAILNPPMVVSDLAMGLALGFIALAAGFSGGYCVHFFRHPDKPDAKYMFLAALLCLVAAFFLLLCPWFKEPAGEVLINQTDKLVALLP